MSQNDTMLLPIPDWTRPIYDDMAELLDAQLVVIGDSHALFFAGTPNKLRDLTTPDALAPHIRTVSIGAALAWNLPSNESSQAGRERTFAALYGLRDHHYTGFAMLSFGAIDLHAHVARHAVQHGLVVATIAIADRYLRFIDEAVLIYGKLAIWGAPGATPDDRVPIFEHFYGAVPTNGNEIDRNYCVMLFNRYLEKRLAERGIPFLTVHDMVIQADGKSRPDYLFDGNHLHNDFMPYVLDLLHMRLGIQFQRSLRHSSYKPEELFVFAELANTQIMPDQVLEFSFPTDLYIDAISFTAANDILIDRIEYSLEPTSGVPPTKVLAENVTASTEDCHIPLGVWTRGITLRFTAVHFVPTQIRLIGRAGYFSRLLNQGNGRPLSMRAAIERLIP